MKFKDFVILAFLSGLLIYAACHRIGLTGAHRGIRPANFSSGQPQAWTDKVHHKQFIFTAHPKKGVLVSNLAGDTLFTSGCQANSLRLFKHPAETGDTLDLLLCSTGIDNVTYCYSILPDGTLMETEPPHNL